MKGLRTLTALTFLVSSCVRIGSGKGNYENLTPNPGIPTRSILEKGEKVKDLRAEDTFSVGYAKYAFAGLFGGGYPPVGYNFGQGYHGGGYFPPYSFGYGPYGAAAGFGIGPIRGGFLGPHHHHHGFHHHHGHHHFGGGYPSFGFQGGIGF